MNRHLGAGVLGGLAVAAALMTPAPAASAADDCADGYLVRCQQQAGPRPVGKPGASRQVGQVPRVQGVPCTGSHLGVCIALTQAGGGSFPGLTTGSAPGPGAVP